MKIFFEKDTLLFYLRDIQIQIHCNYFTRNFSKKNTHHSWIKETDSSE